MDTQTCDDVTYMRRALELALEAYGETAPNPMVGAVVVCDDRIVGEGVHRCAGAPHAEPLALAQAEQRDPTRVRWADASPRPGRDLTLFVTLEPCCHHGLTPPCVDAILASRVGRVVAAIVDPDPRVAGAGVARMRAADLRVDVGCLQREAAELNHVFVARQLRGRPFVALKVALSADDCVAAVDGSARRITGAAAQRHTHRLRAGYAGILVGVETLACDRPQLDRRHYDGPGSQPRRVVLDPQLRTRPEWLWDSEPRALLVGSAETVAQAADRVRGLAARAEVIAVPRRGVGLDLEVLLRALEARGISSLLVEGGGRTHTRFLEAGLWDRVYVYRNPQLRLAGLAWTAANVWRDARAFAELHESVRLGADELEVHVHRASAL